jgi:hypothetical protein
MPCFQKMLVFASMLAAVSLLNACATQPRFYWDNPQLRASGIQQAQYDAMYRGSMAECQAYAANLAASTSPPVRAQQPTYTQYSGTINGMPYQGTAQTGPLIVNPMDQFYAAQREGQRQLLQSNAADACMAQKGWLLMAVTEQPKAQQVNRAESPSSARTYYKSETRLEGQMCNSSSDCVGSLMCEDGNCRSR